MRYDCEIVTYWTTGDEGNVPAINALLSAGDGWSDTTGQPAENLVPDPNALIVRAQISAETLAAIEADPDHLVLWAEEIVTDGK